MTAQKVVDHTRCLCHVSDVPMAFSRVQVEQLGASCQCCGSEMVIEECKREGLGKLEDYWLLCPVCPRPDDRTSVVHRAKNALRSRDVDAYELHELSILARP
jgi:hypothetical protein